MVGTGGVLVGSMCDVGRTEDDATVDTELVSSGLVWLGETPTELPSTAAVELAAGLGLSELISEG